MKSGPRTIDRQVITYFVIIAVIIGLVAYASRAVLFRPWTARRYIASVSHENIVYTFGGLDRHNLPLKDVLAIDLEKQVIKRPAKMRTERYGLAAAYGEKGIYVAGGYNNRKYLSEVLFFDIRKEEFRKIGDLPEARAFGVLAVFQGSLYYFGGWNGQEVADAILKLDLKTGSTEKLRVKMEALQYQTGLRKNDKLYIYGGENRRLENSRTLYVFDLEKEKITGKGELPVGLTRSPAALLDETVYIAGGWSEGPFNKIIRVDFKGGGIVPTVLGELPYNSEDMALAGYEGALYLIGGTELQLKRQIRIVEIDPETLGSESLLFKSFVWW